MCGYNIDDIFAGGLGVNVICLSGSIKKTSGAFSYVCLVHNIMSTEGKHNFAYHL